jgi:general secretion pathway protein F
MLLLVGAFVVLFLLGFVVPRFAVVYESSGREIPALSQLLLAMGMLVHDHGIGLALMAMIVVTVSVWWLRRPLSGRMLMDAVLRLPGIFERATLFRLGRFYRALSLLVISGIALPRAMGMVAGLLSMNQQAALERVRSHIEQGQGVSQALTAGGLASPVAESLIKVGERSGQLGEMLERAAQFHDNEVSRWVDWASRLIEPILMLLIGLVIGAVVVLMYMPIFDLAGSF